MADPWAPVGLLDVSATKKQPKLGPEFPTGQQTGLTGGLVLSYRPLIQSSEPEFVKCCHRYTNHKFLQMGGKKTVLTYKTNDEWILF